MIWRDPLDPHPNSPAELLAKIIYGTFSALISIWYERQIIPR